MPGDSSGDAICKTANAHGKCQQLRPNRIADERSTRAELAVVTVWMAQRKRQEASAGRRGCYGGERVTVTVNAVTRDSAPTGNRGHSSQEASVKTTLQGQYASTLQHESLQAAATIQHLAGYEVWWNFEWRKVVDRSLDCWM